MGEANSQRFRTAVGGFHKGDVSAYIARIAGAHRAEVEELTRQLEALQAENERLASEADTARAELDRLREDRGNSEEAAPAGDIHPENITELELGAYRRAEAAERLAHERARRLYQDMQDIYDRSAKRLRTVSGTAKQALEAMEAAAGSVRTALEETQREALASQTALEELGALVPDPAEGLEEKP